jgi:hypothetical protein
MTESRRFFGVGLTVSSWLASLCLVTSCMPVPKQPGAPGAAPAPATPTNPNANPGMSSAPPAVVEGDWGPVPTQLRGPGAPAPAGFQPQIVLNNQGPARTETLRASVPFPWGMVTDIRAFTVAGQTTDWLVLQRWPDNSVRVAQAQWTQAIPAQQVLLWNVVPAASLPAPSFLPHPVFAGGLPRIGAEVKDTLGVSYRAFWNGEGETVQSTSLVRTRRLRGYLRAATGGIGRDYLTATFYVTEFRDQPVLLVDWLLGNDYLGADLPNGSTDPNLYPLGSVDVNAASFLTRDADLALAYLPATEAIGAPFTTADGHTAFPVLQDHPQGTYLGDGQARRYRFLLLRDDPQATAAARLATRATAQAMMDAPLRPLATLATWRSTEALGLLGGGQAAPSDAAVRADGEYHGWSSRPEFFGTFGNRGDPVATGQTGTPRNHPFSAELLHAVQTQDPRLQLLLEQKAWTQAMRPYHLYGLRVDQSNKLFLWDGIPLYAGGRDLSYESLGRRALLRGTDRYAAYRTRVPKGPMAPFQRAHGFEHFDSEHWTSDLVFDYWTISGDAWAKDEMRQLGESLRGLMRPSFYLTGSMMPARAEGWVMQGLVQAFVATGDIRFRNFALDRLHNIIDRDRPHGHVSGALRIDPDEVRTGFPTPHKYYMPWQHGSTLYGFLAGYKFFGDPLFLDMCKDVLRCVEYGWVRNRQDPNPNLGFVANGLRYYVPVEYQGQPVPPSYFDDTVGVIWGDGPLGGAHQELIGGLFLLASVVGDAALRDKATEFGTLLMRLPLSDDDYWDKWFVHMPASYYR